MNDNQPTITPNELRNPAFAKTFRGYDPVAVTAFLEAVADEMERLIGRVTKAGQKVGDQEVALSEYTQMENAIKQTLVAAEKSASERRELAEKEARLIVEEAHAKSRQVFDEAERRASDLRREIDELTALKARFVSQIETLLNSQSQHLQSLREQLDQNLSSHHPDPGGDSIPPTTEEPQTQDYPQT